VFISPLFDAPSGSALVWTYTTWDASCTGSIFASTAYITLNTAVFAPMPSASVSTQTTVKTGVFISCCTLPADPTIYLVAPTRTDPSQAPKGYDNLKILPHIPYINERQPYSRTDYIALKNLCLDNWNEWGSQICGNTSWSKTFGPPSISSNESNTSGFIRVDARTLATC